MKIEKNDLGDVLELRLGAGSSTHDKIGVQMGNAKQRKAKLNHFLHDQD